MHSKALIAEHEGRIVVLGGWSATMADHVAFYEGLGALAELEAEPKPGARPKAKDRPKARPAVIAMNLDGAVAVKDKVLPLIRKVEPAFANCVFNGEQMMLTAVVDPEWAGIVPAVWIYDRKGALRASFYGAGALDKAKAKLEQMLTRRGRGKRRRPEGE
ncbi:hypothetical protein ACFL09_05035 [Planctomycetota bacterium]